MTFRAADFGVARRRKRVADDGMGQGVPFTLLQTAVAAPFVQCDWNDPRKKKRLTEGWEWPGVRVVGNDNLALATNDDTDTAAFTLTTSGGSPTADMFCGAAFAVPKRPKRHTQVDQPGPFALLNQPTGDNFSLAATDAKDTGAFALTNTPPPPPFFQSDYPNPHRRKHVPEDFQWPGVLIQADARPFRQYDWPTSARKRTKSGSDWLQASIRAAVNDNLSFALTDAKDTASFNLGGADQFHLSGTDAKDAAAFALSEAYHLSLSSSDAKDAAAFSLTEADQFHLTASDAHDAAAFSLGEKYSLALSASDAHDVAGFNIGGAFQLHLSASDAKDVASVSLSEAYRLALSSTDAHDAAAFSLTETYHLALSATDAKDIAAVNLTEADRFTLSVSDAHDAASFNFGSASQFHLAATDAKDAAAFSLAEGYHAALSASDARDVATFGLVEAYKLHLAVNDPTDTAHISFGQGPSFHFAINDKTEVASFALVETFAVIQLSANDAKEKTAFLFAAPVLPLPACSWSMFDVDVVDAGFSIDQLFAECFTFAPYMLAADRSSPDVPDASRQQTTINAVYLDPEVKRVGDRDEKRPPGIETGMPRIEISLYEVMRQTMALGSQFLVKPSDRLVRGNGAVYRVNAVFVDVNGNVKTKVNRIG